MDTLLGNLWSKKPGQPSHLEHANRRFAVSVRALHVGHPSRQASRTRHSHQPAAHHGTLQDEPPAARPCGRGCRNRRRPADPARPRGGRRAHRRESRLVLVRPPLGLTGPGSSTGRGVSSANSLVDANTCAASRACNGSSHQQAPPTQSVQPLAHVRDAERDVHPDPCRNQHHDASPSSRVTPGGAPSPDRYRVRN